MRCREHSTTTGAIDAKVSQSLGFWWSLSVMPAQGEGAACASDARGTSWVYFGTRSTEAGEGIVAARFDASTGGLSSIGIVAEITKPAWLLAHPKLPVLYSVSEVNGESRVFSFRRDASSGKLTLINSVASGDGCSRIGAAASDVSPKWKIPVPGDRNGGGSRVISLGREAGSLAAHTLAADGRA